MATLSVKTYEEVLAQVNILLDNGYDVGIHKEIGLYGNASYLIAYKKPGDRKEKENET